MACYGAVMAMAYKLRKHYNLTAIPFVYSDAVILNPNIRMSMFNDEWDERYGEGTSMMHGTLVEELHTF